MQRLSSNIINPPQRKALYFDVFRTFWCAFLIRWMDCCAKYALLLPLCHHWKVVPQWCERWFINHRNSIDISTLNHSYWSYLHQLSYHKSAIIPIETPYHLCWLNHHVLMVFPWISDISGGHHLVCHTHAHTCSDAHAMFACVPGQAALASEVERGASGESREMDHCQG